MEKEKDTKQDILDCALSLFSEKGYDAVGVAELVAAANITKPTLYYYFGSKEGVFKAILEKYYRAFNNTLKENANYIARPEEYEKDIYPILIEIADMHFKFAKENKKFYLMLMTLMFSPASSNQARLVKPYLEEHFTIITQFFKSVSKVHTNLLNKELRLARNYIALVNSDIANWNLGYGKIDQESMDQLVKQFMHGIFV